MVTYNYKTDRVIYGVVRIPEYLTLWVVLAICRPVWVVSEYLMRKYPPTSVSYPAIMKQHTTTEFYSVYNIINETGNGKLKLV